MIQSAYDTTKLITAHEGAGSNRILSYLPLSHVAGFLLDLMIPIYIPTALGSNLTLYFARPYDLKDGTFGQPMKSISAWAKNKNYIALKNQQHGGNGQYPLKF